MSLRGSLLYTAVAVLLIALIEPSFPAWSWAAAPQFIRPLGARMIMMALAGVGTAILTRRLALEQEQARSARDKVSWLEELDQIRADFVSTISHDLRTPFTAVRAGLGMVEASTADRLRADEQQLIGNVRRNIDRVGILINDLIVFNQFEAGALRLDRAPLDLRAVATNAIATVQPLLAEKNQTLEVSLPESLPCYGDARRLEQVITNLLDNAHRHTPPGTRITVSGSEHRALGNGAPQEVRLAVADDGPGFPSEQFEAIFQRFYNIDREAGGWGLGLAIARTIMEFHEGRIWAESEPGEGCAFYVVLPRDEGGVEL
jgi:two-component system sensor histidine kinase ResE